MDFKDYYAILGVEPGVDKAAIKTAYRKLARKYHPDVSQLPDAENKFKEVAEAYDVLHDDIKRAEYDELRTYGSRKQQGQGFEPPPGWQSSSGSAQSGADFSDFFNSIFGNASGNTRHQQRANPFRQKGQDIELELPVFLEDTLSDEAKSIEYRIPVVDPSGHVTDIKKTLKVKIPAGVAEGERIRLKGQGAPGYDGGENGDVYLHIRLVPHPLFDVEGHNLLITVSLAPWEAALGTRITMPTLTGKIQMSIPSHSQAGQRLRIKGKGLPGKTGIGDLMAVIKIVMPEKTGDEINRLWQALAEKADFDPRAQWNEYSGASRND